MMAFVPGSQAGTTISVADLPSNDGHVPGRVGQTLRRARKHYGLSIREVERRTGRPNAYISQIERGVIQTPDPTVLWELAELYRLDFTLLARWAGIQNVDEDDSPMHGPTTGQLIRLIMNLDNSQRRRALAVLQDLTRGTRS